MATRPTLYVVFTLTVVSLCAFPARAQFQHLPTRLRISNECPFEIWVEQDYLNPTNPADIIVNIQNGQYYDYKIPAAGVAATRFWAKAACDAKGWNCGIGESQSVPTSVSGGDQTQQTIFDSPIDSKFEATWGCVLPDQKDCALNPSNGKPLPSLTNWDASAVDGYTFPFSVLVVGDTTNSCQDQSGNQVTQISCGGLQASSCPSDNLSTGGNFNTINGVSVTSVPLTYTAFTNGTSVVGCFSPCEILTSAAWMGWASMLGNLTPSSNPALMYCCPGAQVSSTQCNTTGVTIGNQTLPAVVAGTNYVSTVHEVCNAYAYSYDDSIGDVSCNGLVQYQLTFCPGGKSMPLPLPPPRVPMTFCNSTVKPPQLCPGNIPCPSTPAACGTNPTACKCPPQSSSQPRKD